ncbi:putative cytochrome P450 9f2 [Anticarsia gemmatalis]|uniref:putative cytochrome P450 9f2 n=1 Tax=Anticarsia gemmatalis TaxID=129554 RepID=UPI003F772D74
MDIFSLKTMRYVGFIEGSKPVILVRDPDLMKLITIKDFNHFVNRKVLFPKEIDPLLGSSLLNMKDDAWREMRCRLTQAFSGSKLKQMFPFMTQISNNIVDYLKDHQSEDVDVIDLMRRYAIDVIASTGFGLLINSVKERDNKFYTIGERAVHFDTSKRLYHFFTTQFPVVAKIMQFLGIQLLSPKDTEFFRRIVADTIERRKEHNVKRPDMINLLMEVAEDWTLDDITGQIFFAFIASYESVASTLTMCIHELSLHTYCEDKLYQEIRKHQENYEELTFENIVELKYLDCVLNESSRKWSVALVMDRVCSMTYTMPPPRDGAEPYVVYPGDSVYGAVNAIHMDSQYHQHPDTFNPDRFYGENKDNIKSFTHMPFGMGPRNCIGLRYTTLEMKVLLYHIVLNYKITRCKKTTDPLKLQPGDIINRAVGETYVMFQSRA